MRTLHVLPTTDAADALLVRLAGDGPLLGRHAVTLRRLEELLVSNALGGRRRIDEGARSLALAEVLGARERPPYDAVADRRGFRRAVERFIVETAQGGARFEELTRAARKLPHGLAARIAALAGIGKDYLSLLSARKLVDPAFALAAACEALEQGAPLPSEVEVEAFHFQHLIDWTPGRLRLLGALAKSSQVVVTLPRSERAEIAEAIEPALRAIEGLSAGIELRLEPLEVHAQVHAFDAADDRGEEREIAARVRALLESGVAPGEIAVVATGLRDRATTFRRALSGFGVPVRDRRGGALEGSQVVRVALALARLDSLAATTRENVAAIVGSRLVALNGRPEVIARHLRQAAVRSRVHDGDGRDGFDSRLARLARAIRGKEADEVDQTRQAIRAFFEQLDRWPHTTTLGRHAKELLTLLQALQVPERLQSLALEAPMTPMAEALQGEALAFEQAAFQRLSEICGQLAEAARAVWLEGKELSRSEFATWLDERCGAETIRTGRTRGAAVELLEPGDLAGRSIEHVLFAGTDADHLPGPPDDETLLADDERRALNKVLGRAVFRTAPTVAEKLALPSRQLLRAADAAVAFGAATKTLTLSHARADDRGRPRVPSPLWALVKPPRAVQMPFSPVDPRLAARSNPSIGARRAAVHSRARAFAEGVPSPWSGDLSAVATMLREVAPGSQQKPLSGSALETFVACAFRWFGERLLKLEEEADASQLTSAMDAGRLAHAAVEAAVREMVGRNLWRLDRKDEAVETGILAAARVLDALEPQTVVGHPQLRSVDRERLLRRLARILSLELEATTRAGQVPQFLELGFGGRGDELPALELDGIYFGGRIDRLDTGAAGATVLDWKSSSAASNQARLGEARLMETEFQLALYVTAVRELLPEHRAVDALYVSLRNGERSASLREKLPLSYPELKEKLSATARDAVASMREGRFAPEPRSCDFCALRPVCRIPRPEGSA